MEEAEKSTNAEQEKAEDAKRKLEEQEKSERAEKERARREAERKEQELKEHELQKGKMKRDPDQKSRSSTTERAENLRKSHSLADELSKPPTSAEKDSDAVSVKSSKSVKALAAVFGGASKKDDKEKDKEKRKSVGKLSDSKGSIDNLKEKVDAETKTVKSGQVSMKGTKCEVRLEDSELHCIEGKGKPAKHFFPLELRRIVSAEHSGATTTLHACTPRKGGKSGSKLKKIVLQWTDESLAKGFAETLSKQVYGESPSTLMRSVLVLVDKYDGEAYGKLVTKYMKPVWDAVHKPCEIKTVQFNEFSVANALSVQNFKTVGNIICTNPEFMSKLMQVIVRNSYSTSPLNLPVEPDPVDSALTILRCKCLLSNGT
ncbi:hypothetical protein BJ742DRAFT_92433 [Cladochytrium replicatum]|nr:hypothetical protein BJ742DRAFT_92433 [Cladochytrium replicatum]